VLALLANRFDDELVKIDRSIHNPARIIKLYGTRAAKGDNTSERPHRLSKILYVPDSLLIVTEEQLRALVEELKTAAPTVQEERPAAGSRSRGVFDVDAYLQRHALEVVNKFTKPDGTIVWQLAVCVFNPDHAATSVVVMQLPSGALVYKCSHSSCADKHWQDFRRHFEPDYDKPKPKVKSAGEPERPRIAILPRPAQEITIARWRAIVGKNFPTLLRPAEVCLSVEVQLLLNDVFNPFALALIDVPSSGKTIILNFFDGLPELTYTTDNFTPAAFVSHAAT